MGSSVSTVSAPVRIAPARARQCCTSSRAAAPVIHFAADQVTAQAIGRAHGTFEIDDRAIGQLAERGARFL